MHSIADLHIHSRFSRATSKQINLPYLATWARCKGINILGTGDFTHPAWRKEMRECLVFDENTGLYSLKDNLNYCLNVSRETNPNVSRETFFDPILSSIDNKRLTNNQVQFCLQTEISTIYKKNNRVYKIHLLVFMPDLETADKFSEKLALIGNIASDGRPILGLDARNLLEIVLETSENAYMIPAHIWTPWFSLFGSKSGFDDLEDCFLDLSPHIFALETGLSSDPEMNRLISKLDRYTLISNSDAHSGANLGREANIFTGKISYQNIFTALKNASKNASATNAIGQSVNQITNQNLEQNLAQNLAKNLDNSSDCQFLGTLEFYPEEGKYHLDGHRNCKVVMNPKDAIEANNICPVCGKPLTIGVLHRVWELADRQEPAILTNAPAVYPLVPLPNILAEILGLNVTSKKVQEKYIQVINELGADLEIIYNLPESDIRHYWEPLGEAIVRMRRGQVLRSGGYDGEYGTVQIFNQEELADIQRQAKLYAVKSKKSHATKVKEAKQEKQENLLLFKAENLAKDLSKNLTENLTDNLTDNLAENLADMQENSLEQKVSGQNEVEQNKTGQNRQDQILANALNNSLAQISANFSYSLEQLRAISAKAPALVLAGPGAGKTRVLVGRIAYLLESGIKAEKILALTFIKRAALEIEQRLRANLKLDKDNLEQALKAKNLVHCNTIHGYAWQVLQFIAKQSAITCYLLPEDATKAIFSTINPDLDAKQCLTAINAARECNLALSQLPQKIRDAYRGYLDYKDKQAQIVVDYADLPEWLYYFLKSLRAKELISSTWLSQKLQNLCKRQAQILSASTDILSEILPEHILPDHILLDEAQDLSALQMLLFKELAINGAGFFAIGDPDQAIYAFRGAKGQNATDFLQLWPNCQILHLTNNYRSSQKILDMAQNLLHKSASSEKLTAISKEDAYLSLYKAFDDRDEAKQIASQIKELLGATSHSLLDATVTKIPLVFALNDIAILVRLKAQIPVLQLALAKAGIPYAVPEMEPFWSDNLCSAILTKASNFYTNHFYTGKNFNKSVNKINEQIESKLIDLPVSEEFLAPEQIANWLMEHELESENYFKQSAWLEFVKNWHKFGNWSEFLADLALLQEADNIRTKSERVQILTLHAAKGLEFPVVFIPGLEEGLLPLDRNKLGLDFIDSYDFIASNTLEAERHLFYVGMTRAKRVVFLSYCKQRNLYGRKLHLKPATFLNAVKKYCEQSTFTVHGYSQKLPLIK